MSLPEQGARVATSAIDALRNQPILLAVLVLNVIMFVAIAYAVVSNRTAQHEVMKTLLEQNAKATELLSRCIVPRNTSGDDSEARMLPL